MLTRQEFAFNLVTKFCVLQFNYTRTALIFVKTPALRAVHVCSKFLLPLTLFFLLSFCCFSRHALFGLFLSHHSSFWKEILYHIMKIKRRNNRRTTEQQQKNNRKTTKDQRKSKRGKTYHVVKIRGKLKSRTGHWSVRDFNFVRILRNLNISGHWSVCDFVFPHVQIFTDINFSHWD